MLANLPVPQYPPGLQGSEGTGYGSSRSLSLMLLLYQLHLCIAYCICPVVGVKPWVLLMLGRWVVPVTMVVCQTLVTWVAESSVGQSLLKWGQVAQVVMQVLLWWQQEALVAVAIACPA